MRTGRIRSESRSPTLSGVGCRLARQQLQWLGHVWLMDWSRLAIMLLTAWVPVEERGVGGCELTWG
jgi:hypothetical protein